MRHIIIVLLEQCPDKADICLILIKRATWQIFPFLFGCLFGWFVFCFAFSLCNTIFTVSPQVRVCERACAFVRVVIHVTCLRGVTASVIFSAKRTIAVFAAVFFFSFSLFLFSAPPLLSLGRQWSAFPPCERQANKKRNWICQSNICCSVCGGGKASGGCWWPRWRTGGRAGGRVGGLLDSVSISREEQAVCDCYAFVVPIIAIVCRH